MRIRRLALAAAATLPFTLSACGGASVADFCAQFDAIDRIEEPDGVKDGLEELAGNVPDDAGDDLQQAVDFLAENFPEDGDLEAAVENGDVSEDEAREFGTAAGTIATYGDENCG